MKYFIRRNARVYRTAEKTMSKSSFAYTFFIRNWGYWCQNITKLEGYINPSPWGWSDRTIRVHKIYNFCINPFLQCQKSYNEVSISILFNILGPSALICYEIGDRQNSRSISDFTPGRDKKLFRNFLLLNALKLKLLGAVQYLWQRDRSFGYGTGCNFWPTFDVRGCAFLKLAHTGPMENTKTGIDEVSRKCIDYPAVW